MVTTVLAACQWLARQPAHEDLLGVRFQVLPGYATCSISFLRPHMHL